MHKSSSKKEESLLKAMKKSARVSRKRRSVARKSARVSRKRKPNRYIQFLKKHKGKMTAVELLDNYRKEVKSLVESVKSARKSARKFRAAGLEKIKQKLKRDRLKEKEEKKKMM